MSKTDTVQLAVGDKAPAFTLPTDGGGKVSLSSLKGQIVVLYFYPKDDTSGCTREAIEFSAAKAKFDKLGAVVIGCSRDSVASHDKFKGKHKLTVTLAADERSEEHTSELQSLMRISYAVFC